MGCVRLDFWFAKRPFPPYTVENCQPWPGIY
jgi:hypothetical protein